MGLAGLTIKLTALDEHFTVESLFKLNWLQNHGFAQHLILGQWIQYAYLSIPVIYC